MNKIKTEALNLFGYKYIISHNVPKWNWQMCQNGTQKFMKSAIIELKELL